jgi:hypothetical protein
MPSGTWPYLIDSNIIFHNPRKTLTIFTLYFKLTSQIQLRLLVITYATQFDLVHIRYKTPHNFYVTNLSSLIK